MILPKRRDTVAHLIKILETNKEYLLCNDNPSPTICEYPHHWGKIELRAFLDWLYGGPPKNKTEELNFKDY